MNPHGRKGYSAATGRERRDMPVKRASVKTKSRRVFGHPGKLPKAALRAGLYARVSTNDQQTLPMQLRALREYAARRGWMMWIAGPLKGGFGGEDPGTWMGLWVRVPTKETGERLPKPDFLLPVSGPTAARHWRQGHGQDTVC
jgi:hypothetical protein